MNIGIYIYDQAEVLDFSGPFEVFAIASRVCEPPPLITVSLIGETGETVSSRPGYSVNPTLAARAARQMECDWTDDRSPASQ